MIQRLKDIIQKEADAVLNIPVEINMVNAVTLILKQCHSSKRGKVVCSGMGKAGQIALNISTTLSSTGTPAVYLHPSEAQHGDIGLIQENDVLLLISNSGKTREVEELIYLSKNLDPSIKIIGMTRNHDSPLAKLVDITILTGETVEICPLGMTPTTSTTVMTVIGDLLVYGIMEQIGFSKEEYSKRHHGGYLGEKSRLTK
jgi:arabinose-5-phosphate isomerase